MTLCLAEECIIIGLHEGKRGERERGKEGLMGQREERGRRESREIRETEIKSGTKTERFSLSLSLDHSRDLSIYVSD